MKKLKVMTILGTRPEIIRLSALIAKLDEHTQHLLVHTGQNTDPNLNEVFFRDLGLRNPDHYLEVDTSSLGTVMGETLSKTEKLLLVERPDAVLILGDTNSAMAAIIVERMGIPVYHMEAGNRSYDANVPEELNRRLVDHVASFNLPYNSYSKSNLLSEGIHPRRIQTTGSPMLEVIKQHRSKIDASSIVRDLGLEKQGYFLASFHRQENVDIEHRLQSILQALEALSRDWNLPTLVSTHPRTRKRLESGQLGQATKLVFHEPFGYFDYNKLQLEAKCVISDSGTISEEASILGFKAVTIRDSMERPEALANGAMTIAGIHADGVSRAVDLVLNSSEPEGLPEGYEVDNFSDRVLRFVISTAPLHKAWLGLHSL